MDIFDIKLRKILSNVLKYIKKSDFKYYNISQAVDANSELWAFSTSGKTIIPVFLYIDVAHYYYYNQLELYIDGYELYDILLINPKMWASHEVNNKTYYHLQGNGTLYIYKGADTSDDGTRFWFWFSGNNLYIGNSSFSIKYKNLYSGSVQFNMKFYYREILEE